MPKRHRDPITKHILIIRQSLSAIDRALGRLVALTDGAGRGASVEPEPKRRKLKLSPARRARLKLQGSYMGYLKQLKPRQQAQVKALRAAKGVRAAIAVARRTAKLLTMKERGGNWALSPALATNRGSRERSA